jgi:hypothetical protein
VSPSDGSVVPCLGTRAFGLTASADDVPLVADKAGVMKISTLTMNHMKYDGVVTLKTKSGRSIEALKFSMFKATNDKFSLTVDEPGSATTAITSDKLITATVCPDGKDDCDLKNVKFYTTKFQGWLGGIIPVTFTPDLPPPDLPDLGIPLIFTGVTIQLNYVRSDKLTGDPLKVTEKVG